MERWLLNAALTAFAAVGLVFILAPLAIVAILSFSSGESLAFPPPGYSLRWYRDVLSYEPIVESFILSIQIASVASIVALLLGVPASVALVRHRFPGREVLSSFFLSPLVFPQLVTAVALLQLFNAVAFFQGSMALLIAGHVVITFPFVVRAVVVSLQGFDRAIEDAARVHGAGALSTFLLVTLPNIKTGLLTGTIFAMIVSFSNFPVSYFLASPTHTPFSVRVYGIIYNEYSPFVLAAATAVVFIVVVLLAVATRVSGGERLSRTL